MVWAVYCLVFPLYKLSHFLWLIIAAAAFVVLSKLFPGKVIDQPLEEPSSAEDSEVNALLKEGNLAVSELRRLRNSINGEMGKKIDQIIDITEKIFKDIVEDPDDIPQVKRFASYYLPTTIKLLNAYDRMSAQNISGENIDTTLTRIEDILDTTIIAYQKQLDSLFANQAFDIETDITVLENMLKREGFSDKDF